MHIPDGFLNISTWIPTWVLSVGVLVIAVGKVKDKIKDKIIPLMGVSSAFIFAAQMLNFPVAGGTSGHLLGGVLAAILLGPWAGTVCLSVVLIVQCLIFQDGGLTALGANILNMAIIGVISGYIIYAMLKKRFGMILATAVASWFSVIMASTACAVELAISGTCPVKIVLPAMVFVHMIIGIGEAVITCLVIGFINKTRPDLIYI